ncbi:MAG TPA: 4'-phosphopantetheinyl transferase superfamily protein [Solirubrobacterales bacterium]
MSWEPGPPEPAGPGEEIHLWRADLDAASWPAQEELPPADRARAEEFLRPEPARRWAAARWALRIVLGRYLGEDPAAILLALAPGGKPRLDRPGPLRFSLSHSEGLALIALGSEREIGVDVERLDPDRDLVALARAGLDPDDAEAVASAGVERRADLFYAAWTRREAVVKCFGEGLGAAAPSERPVEVSEIDAGEGWAAALAVAGVGLPAIRRFELRA